MQGDCTSLFDDSLKGIVVFFVVPGYKESSFGIVFLQDVKDLFRIFRRTVVKGQINDLLIVGFIFLTVTFRVVVPVFPERSVVVYITS